MLDRKTLMRDISETHYSELEDPKGLPQAGVVATISVDSRSGSSLLADIVGS